VPTSVESRLARPRRISRVGWRIRAALTHVRALLREFRLPLLAFIVVTVGGGFVYGELYRSIRGEFIPMVDRPYIMLQLMLLEAPEAVPPELPLVAFWYVLPVLFIILVGLGAADFLDLFFNRDENRDRWGEALAMTFKNHVIVLGAGHVGLRVVRDLHDMGLEVAVIDLGPDDLAQESLRRMSIPVIMGDARSGATLNLAGLEHAGVFVVCTHDDRLNLEVAMKVRELRDDIRIVARVWDQGLGRRMEQFEMVDAVLSAADLAAPAFAGAALGIEITQTLRIRGDEYSTVRFEVRPGGPLQGMTVAELEAKEKLEVVLVGNDAGSRVDPPADQRLEAGDEVVIFARHDRVLDVVTRNRKR
jgi:Trk K+ transport system NAD-binding subunit